MPLIQNKLDPRRGRVQREQPNRARSAEPRSDSYERVAGDDLDGRTHTHSVAHSQWKRSIIRPIVRAPTSIVVNQIATPVSAPSTKLTSTSHGKKPSTNLRASGSLPRCASRSK